MNDLEIKLENLLVMVKSHNDSETSYNKAQSARIRAALGELKKDVSGIRAGLVAQDKQK